MQKSQFNPIPHDFYTRTDVVQIAYELLGKVLYTSFNNELTAGIIIETEAYAGVTDKASHAWNNRRTIRTEVMYQVGGLAYVYLCYGMHSLFNIVTSKKEDPQAVLIRAIEPLHGKDIMARRKGKTLLIHKDGVGPGNVAKLLGIHVNISGLSLCQDLQIEQAIWIQDEGISVPDTEVKVGPRVGIEYAEEDAFLPFRYQWIKK